MIVGLVLGVAALVSGRQFAWSSRRLPDPQLGCARQADDGAQAEPDSTSGLFPPAAASSNIRRPKPGRHRRRYRPTTLSPVRSAPRPGGAINRSQAARVYAQGWTGRAGKPEHDEGNVADLDAERLRSYGAPDTVSGLQAARAIAGRWDKSARRARALYLFVDNKDTSIPASAAQPRRVRQIPRHAVSSGCIRMRDLDAIDLYSRVHVGTPVPVVIS